MSQQLIGLGAANNDGTGDPLRTGGQKINSNFTELYTNAVVSQSVTVGNSSINSSINTTTIQVTTLVVNTITANGSNGTGLQVLTSSGNTVYWGSPTDLSDGFVAVTFSGSANNPFGNNAGNSFYKSDQVFVLANTGRIDVDGFIFKYAGNSASLGVQSDGNTLAYWVTAQSDGNYIFYHTGSSMAASGTSGATWDFTSCQELVMTVVAAVSNTNDNRIWGHINSYYPQQVQDTNVTLVNANVHVYVLTDNIAACTVKARVLANNSY
jgi:hypothetical protein